MQPDMQGVLPRVLPAIRARRWPRRVALAVSLLVVAACSVAERGELRRNRAKWETAGIERYRYELFIGCFCAFSADMPLAIEVRDGEPVSLAYLNGKEMGQGDRKTFESYATIDRLFAKLDAAVSGRADEVAATYDAELGFPSDVDIDYEADALDDELRLTVSGFERVR